MRSKKYTKLSPPNAPKPNLERPQILQNRGLGGPLEPKFAQEAPKTSQEVPKKHSRGPKSCPRVPKSRPSGAKELAKTASDPSKTQRSDLQNEFSAQSLLAAVWERLGSDFVSFFCSCGKLAIKNLEKPRKNYGFCTSQAFSHWKLARAKRTRKMRPWDFQNLSQTFLKPSKIDPGAIQDPQKPAQSYKKRSKMRQMRPRSAQERKMEPTWSQKTGQKAGELRMFGSLDPPCS